MQPKTGKLQGAIPGAQREIAQHRRPNPMPQAIETVTASAGWTTPIRIFFIPCKIGGIPCKEVARKTRRRPCFGEVLYRHQAHASVVR
jgi:hypothetical protein